MFTINDYINECLYAINNDDYFNEKNLIMYQIIEAIWQNYLDDYIENVNETHYNFYLKNDVSYYMLINENSEKIKEININYIYNFCKTYKNDSFYINYITKIHEYNSFFHKSKFISSDIFENKYKSKLFSQNYNENIYSLKNILNNGDNNLKYNFIISMTLNKCNQHVPNFSKLIGIYPYFEEVILINKKLYGFEDIMHPFGNESFIINTPKIKNKDDYHFVFKTNTLKIEEYALIYETFQENKTHFDDLLNVKDGYIQIFGIIFQVIRAMYVAHKECKFSHGDLNMNNVVMSKLKDELYIAEYDDIMNFAKKYNFNFKYQRVETMATIMDYGLSQIDLDKHYIINDSEDNNINVNRLNKYLYNMINQDSTSLHDVFKYIMYINMYLHKVEFNKEQISDTEKDNILNLKNIIRNVFLNFFFSDIHSHKELEYLYLSSYDSTDEYKKSKKIWNTFYIFPTNLNFTNDFTQFIDHIFKNIRSNQYQLLIDVNFRTTNIPEKTYKSENIKDPENDNFKSIEIIYENYEKIIKNLDLLSDYIIFINDKKQIPKDLSNSEYTIKIEELFCKFAVYYVYYMLIYENIYKEFSYHYYKINDLKIQTKKYENLLNINNLYINKKYINLLEWIFENFGKSKYFTLYFINYESMKESLTNFYQF